MMADNKINRYTARKEKRKVKKVKEVEKKRKKLRGELGGGVLGPLEVEAL